MLIVVREAPDSLSFQPINYKLTQMPQRVPSPSASHFLCLLSQSFSPKTLSSRISAISGEFSSAFRLFSFFHYENCAAVLRRLR